MFEENGLAGTDASCVLDPDLVTAIVIQRIPNVETSFGVFFPGLSALGHDVHLYSASQGRPGVCIKVVLAP